MNLINIFVDRVNNINTFNLFESRKQDYYTHLSTIVDDDLIQEFLIELDSLGQLVNSLGETGGNSSVEFATELKRIGTAFFSQFIPEALQEYLRLSVESFLFLHVAPKLGNIPWELLYNTDHFLAERFYIAKNTFAYWCKKNPERRESLRMLIVTDPTEDLEWARQEGEELLESLYVELSIDRIDIQLLSGCRINKIQILQAIKECDILHYAGHLYSHPDPDESGWLLADGKVLRAREIKKAGAMLRLVFSNSCSSSALKDDRMESVSKKWPQNLKKDTHSSNLANAFMRTGLCNYVGTLWELKDSQATSNFALYFYRFAFENTPLAKALFETRKFVSSQDSKRNMTWTNYVLHGDPLVRILRFRKKRSFDASRTGSLLWHVRETYPLPIARSYLALLDFLGNNNHKENDHKRSEENFKLLCTVFQSSMQILAAISFSNCRYFKITIQLPDPDVKLVLKETIAWIYKCNDAFQVRKAVTVPARFVNVLYMHRKEIRKLLAWSELYYSGKFKRDDVETYLVTFQYLLENFLEDLSSFQYCQLFYVHDWEKPVILLSGSKLQKLSGLPSAINAIKKQKQKPKQVYLFHPDRNVLISLEHYLGYDVQNQELLFFPFAAS